MKKYLLLATLSAAATAAPALAQYPSQGPQGRYSSPDRYGAYSPQRLIERLAARIDTNIRNGRLSRFEGQRLRDEADRLRRLDYQYRLNGLSGLERRDLARRVDLLRDNVLAAERGGYSARGRGYDRSDDRDDIFTDYDRDNDGWDDRDRDRNDRFDDGDDRVGLDRNSPRFDSDDPRDEFVALPSDSNGRLDTGDPRDFGADGDDEELGVGDRAPMDLDPVPSYLRGRYRDGSGLIYRYRDGTIYQIDSRTNVIRWTAEIPE